MLRFVVVAAVIVCICKKHGANARIKRLFSVFSDYCLKIHIALWFARDAKMRSLCTRLFNYKILFNVEFLMAWSRRDFNYGRWWRRRWWYHHIFNRTNMILNFNERLLRIFKTTFGAGYWLHIETGFHFNWNIYTTREHKSRGKNYFFSLRIKLILKIIWMMMKKNAIHSSS